MAARAKMLVLLLACCCLPVFSHAHDAFNRISSVSESGGATWSRTYTYDQYGNRAATGLQMTVATPASTSAYAASTNRMTTTWATYDNGGNLTVFKDPNGTSPGRWTAGYDAENKQRYYCAGVLTACTATTHDVEYVYDGEGNRVLKEVTNGAKTTYVYDAFGRLAAEYTVGGASETAGTFYRTTDHLGSTRLVVDSAGNVKSRRDFFPFGEQIPAASSSGRNIAGYNDDMAFPQLFTAKERDDESGLDYFGARYMSSALGRFTSADAPFMDQSPVDPRSWNLYSYTRNNPLRYVDSSGNYIETAWDVANVGFGVASFIDNVRQGNYGSATLDAVGVVLDSAAVVAPFVPAGAGVLIKGARAADKLDDVADGVKTLRKADDAADTAKTTTRNPYGSKGKPDHQAKVEELVDKAKGEARPGEQVVRERKIQGHDSNRRPDVQVVGPDGRTRKVYEAERRPTSPRNRTREEEYRRHEIDQETHGLK